MAKWRTFFADLGRHGLFLIGLLLNLHLREFWHETGGSHSWSDELHRVNDDPESLVWRECHCGDTLHGIGWVPR